MSYIEKLKLEHPDVAVRYIEKLSKINNIDPYELPEDVLSFHPDYFPPVTNMDIVAYLVITTSFYTNENMVAYKSLNAYKYFEAGYVTKCGCTKINNFSVLIGQVKHSQRANVPAVKVWLLISENGSIITAHCTCMAGAGEVCSHVGALLFAVEFINSVKSSTSCTDVRALWNVPSTSKVSFAELKDITRSRVFHTPDLSDVPPLQGADLVSFINKFKETGATPVIGRILEPFASEIASSIISLVENPWNGLFTEDCTDMDYETIILLTSSIQISISQEDCLLIEEKTREQSNSEEWFNQRAGRITASRFKDCCKTSLEKPSLSLIKTICYPTKTSFTSKATQWGNINEKNALKEFETYASPLHRNLRISNTGFHVNSDYIECGASPDAIVNCECCGKGCIEIKCPYKLKDLSIDSFSKIKNSFLIKHVDDISLDRTHAYFYQVQMQMGIAQMKYCEFIVWSPKEMFIERLEFNEDFFLYHLQIAQTFHRKIIVPELVGRFFTKQHHQLNNYCVCQQNDDDSTLMIKCKNENCEISWFHLKCVGLENTPEYLWKCDMCA